MNELRNEFQPPLVEELFSPRPRSFNPILNKYPRARALSSYILSKLAQGKSLETILRELESDKNPNVRKQFWQVPLYLQELMGEVTAHYFVSGGTKFEELALCIERSNYDEVLYITLNYDLFMENALRGLYGIIFNNLNSYVQNKWALVKLHGSVDWGRRIQNQDDGRQNDLMAFLDSIEAELVLGDEIVWLPGYQLRGRIHEGRFYYPALALPIADKSSFSCHPSLVERTRAFFNSCQDYLFIGFSARDLHVLQLLSHAPRVRKFALVSGSEHAARQAIENIAAMNHQFDLGDRFPNAPKALQMGFREFVSSGELERFLAH